MNEFTSTTAQEQAANDETSHDATGTLAAAQRTNAVSDKSSAATQPESEDASHRHIPLSRLVASPLNVRKSGGQDIDELAMLILSQGLLQGLVVIPHVTKKGKPTDKFEVVAGGRRRRALARLAELGKIASDEKVLCKLTTREKALAASVAENSAREPMSKPDTVQAFAAMVASGATPEDISVSFGITPLTVMRRLKLANVSPKLFELYRAEEITTEQMMALAIVDDHETQERVWEGTSQYDRHPSTLRRLLLGREIEAARDPEAIYVGVQAYEDAGGRIIRDLFDEDQDAGYIGDAELLHKLATEKLQAEADTLSGEGWRWTEAKTKFDYSERNQFAMAAMTLREPTAKERTKLAAFEKEQQEGIPYVEETVRRIHENGNPVTFNFYSRYGVTDPAAGSHQAELLAEALRVKDKYPKTVLSHPYFIRTLITGRSHWDSFGYQNCPSISESHPAHASRLENGNPTLRSFNAWSADLKTVKFCCTSGHCNGCRDSQAIFSWLLVSMDRFCSSRDQLLTWIEIAESYWSQFCWAPRFGETQPMGQESADTEEPVAAIA